MNKKIILIIIGVLSLASILLFYKFDLFQSNESKENIIKENTVALEDASVSVVTFGKRIEHDDVYFYQWEALNENTKVDVLKNEQVFLFSLEEFQNKKNEDIVLDLLDSKKTVLFFGYQMDVEKILSNTSFNIPYYEMHSTKPIQFYLYGAEYSEDINSLVPVTVLGNFPENEMSEKIVAFLKKHYGIE